VLFLASLMGIGVYLAKYLPLENNIALLLSQVFIGIILYIALCRITNISSFVEIRSIAQDKYKSIRILGTIFKAKVLFHDRFIESITSSRTNPHTEISDPSVMAIKRW